jgi:preprotein translocase subunit YajC
MMNLKALHVILADAATPTGATGQATATTSARNQTGETVQFVGMMVIIGLMMYFLMIRPQQKKAKEQAAMLNALKEGDKVMTASGIMGVVISIKDRTVTLRSADTKLEVIKSAITEVIKDPAK